MNNYAELYRNELLEQVIPFWDKFSPDTKNGGFFTCLSREGEVFDTDKFIWLQARAVWTYSTLYTKVKANNFWLQQAEQGASFLQKYGRDQNGDWYFSLTAEGKPLVQSYNIFSDCFAAMAFASSYKATQKQEYANIALQTFERILARKDNPKGVYEKRIGENRPLKNFSLPMILCNLCLEMEHLLPAEKVEQIIEDALAEVMGDFYDEETGLILENVLQDGSRSDCFDGRLINPGHAIEAMWFVMDLAERKKDQQLIERALDIALKTLEYGWDQQFGGIFYFKDIKGAPTQQLEWDQKLWWVHLESLVCMAKAWKLTANENALLWFEKIHNYAWEHFRDPEFGEWYGYLNRAGEVLLPLKGGKWKGFFHVPRALFEISDVFEEVSNVATTNAIE